MTEQNKPAKSTPEIEASVEEATAAPENTAQTDQNPSEEEQREAAARTQEMLEALHKAGRRLIRFSAPLHTDIAQLLDKTLDQLDALSAKITDIRTQIVAQHEEISGRVATVDASELVSVNIDVERAKESVNKYCGLLDRLLEEIGHEVANLKRHRALEQDTYVQAWQHEPAEFNAYMRHKVGVVRKQTKRIERDLDVSYSRYKFSFENHRKQLKQVEALLAYNKAIQKHKEAQAAAEQEKVEE